MQKYLYLHYSNNDYDRFLDDVFITFTDKTDLNRLNKYVAEEKLLRIDTVHHGPLCS